MDDAPVPIPIEDVLDLHLFSPRDVPELLEEYLFQCREKGILSVRIIHGKGTGAQKRRVRSLLEKSPHVRSVADAPPEAGGWGATLADLFPA